MPPTPRRTSFIRLSLGALALAFVVSHMWALSSESINWDELGLFKRAADSIQDGKLHGGGRPGLGALLTMPMVRGCSDAIAVVHSGRLFTAVATFAFLIAFFVMLQRLLRKQRPEAWIDAALGVALLACVPAFLRWSLQARTDQWALMCGTWAGVLLMASRQRRALSFAAGVLFAIGFLFTQKLAYTSALCLWFAIGEQVLERDFDRRRELQRGVLLAVGAGLVFLVYFGAVLPRFEGHSDLSLDKGMAALDFYRAAEVFEVYVGMLQTVPAHIALSLLLILATLLASRIDRKRELVVAWGFCALGIAIGMFHSAAFPYFWMTLGMFPAAAFAVALGPIREMLASPRTRAIAQVSLWLMLMLPAIPSALLLCRDTQKIQRDALGFVDRNFPPSARGFHPEGGLFCRKDPDPFPIWFTHTIVTRLATAPAQLAFMAQFASRPVMFIVGSHRLAQFPPAVITFLMDHYVAYGPSVMIPGFYLPLGAERGREVQVLIPGTYRWVPNPMTARGEIDGKPVQGGETVVLQNGQHRFRALDKVQTAVLAYAVPEQPRVTHTPFYSVDMLREFDFGN